MWCILTKADAMLIMCCDSGISRSSRSPAPNHSSSGSSPEQVEVKFDSEKSADSESKVSPTQVTF